MCAGSGLHVLLWSMLSTSIQYHLLGTVGFENQQSLQCDAQRHANAHSGNARQGARNRVGWKQQGHNILTLTLDLLVHVLSKKVCDWTHEWLTWHTDTFDWPHSNSSARMVPLEPVSLLLWVKLSHADPATHLFAYQVEWFGHRWALQCTEICTCIYLKHACVLLMPTRLSCLFAWLPVSNSLSR